jgi:hypothetical protein
VTPNTLTNPRAYPQLGLNGNGPQNVAGGGGAREGWKEEDGANVFKSYVFSDFV